MLLVRWLLSCAQCGTVTSCTCYHFSCGVVLISLVLPGATFSSDGKELAHRTSFSLGYDTKLICHNKAAVCT
jgi:hypothetical protein